MHGKLIYNGDSIPAGGGRQKWCFSVTSAGCGPQKEGFIEPRRAENSYCIQSIVLESLRSP